MLVYAGIDEAGYGPLLGPLCVGCTVFVLEEHDPSDGAPKLWSLLRSAVCRKPTDRKRRVAVDDSKKLKGANDGPAHPLRHLERGVMSFLPHAAPPATCAALIEALGGRSPARPWLDSNTDLPVAHTADELRIARGRVRRALDRARIQCAAMWCEAVDPETLNLGVAETGSKAEVNFQAAMRLVERLWAGWPDAHPRVILDRHGGRVRYGEALEAALAGKVGIVAETPSLSRYTVTRADSTLTVTFAQDGDCRYLPVALSSMTAKYVRELLMLRLNRFFIGHLPELRPTAGYYGDARRFITEIKPVLRRLRLPAAQLIRDV